MSRSRGVEERIVIRLLDQLDQAQVSIGQTTVESGSPDHRVLLLRQTGPEALGSEWVALNASDRAPLSVVREDGETLLLHESACTVFDAGEQQDLHLTASMATEHMVPVPGAGLQVITGQPIVVELDARPESLAQGCALDFLMHHSLMPRQPDPPRQVSDSLQDFELAFTTMTQTRAVAVVLATELVVSFGLHTQVVEHPGASALLGRLQLVRHGVNGLPRSRFRELYAPDTLLEDDSRELRVKPSLDRQKRDAVLAPPGTVLCWNLEIPAQASLRFAQGVAWPHSVSPGRDVTFLVRLGEEVLYEETVSPHNTGWGDRRLQLDLSEQEQELCFETRAEQGPGTIWSLLGTPEVTTTASSTEEGPETTSERPRTIILVSIDSLRANRLGLYGYEFATSPRMDALARESVVFENHTAQTGWTLPSHVSMLTGLAPEAHGVSGQMDRILDLIDMGFDPTVPTLAAALREAGYSTHAIVSAPYLDPSFGFDRGFDSYDSSTVSSHTASHQDITAPRLTLLTRRLINRSATRPLFLFLHHWDVHYDYIPPREDLAAVHPMRGRQRIDYNRVRHPFTRHIDPALLRLVTSAGPYGSPPEFYRRIRQMLPQYPDVRSFMRLMSDLYDGEIHSVDRHLGQIFAELERVGRHEAVVIVTSDHGESFLEHGTLGHGVDNIYREGLVVPFFIRAPGRLEPGRRQYPSMTIDIAPTILSLAGVDPMPGFQGRSLVQSESQQRVVVGHDGSWSRVQATRGNLRLLIWGEFGPDLLFDIADDPEEREELGESRSAERAALRREVARYLLQQGRGLHVAVEGDEALGEIEVILEADEPLQPAFVYGPPESGRILWEDEQRRLRLQASPASGEIVALTALVPDELELRFRALRRGPRGEGVATERVFVGAGEPLRNGVSDDRWVLTSGTLPQGLGDRSGSISLWRTPAYSVRMVLTPQDETFEQLRALGYLRDRPPQRASPDASVPADARPARSD